MTSPGTERDIIARIREQSAAGGGGLIAGIGDDCAVYGNAAGKRSLVTLDTLVEGIHFDLLRHPPDKLGRKAVSVNVSDIAAMGGTPRFALLSLALPASVEATWLDSFMDGFLAQLKEYAVLLIGGDTVRSGQEIVISVTVIGEGEDGSIIYRSGAREGDLVMVSGCLGEAAAGLAVLQRGSREDAERWPQLLEAHFNPVVQGNLGVRLAGTGAVHAMMDLSDGLATDLAHICAESRVGAEVFADTVPMSDPLRAAACRYGADPLRWALQGGEDYQLLFTCAPAAEDTLRAAAAGRELYCVGRITAGQGVILARRQERRDISYQGYDHFSP